MRVLTTLLLSSSSQSAFINTRYSITCPATDPDVLASNVRKHVSFLDKFLANKPIAAHTAAAYNAVMKQIRQSPQREEDTTRRIDNLVLDSGCGTGRSSIVLGREIHPNATVIGVDRSLVRLTSNTNNEQQVVTSSRIDDDEGNPGLLQHIPPNVWLVRAELVDFWRLLCKDPSVTVQHHYLLYPNPYPKRSRLSSRWYGHASFPILLHVANQTTTIRSNWELYLQEMATATRIAMTETNESLLRDSQQTTIPSLLVEGPFERKPSERAWTNFEQKFWNVEERTFELVLRRCSVSQYQARSKELDEPPAT